MTILEKFQLALRIHDEFGAQPDESPIMIDSRADNTLYELIDGLDSGSKQITLGDLRELVEYTRRIQKR